MKTRSIAILAAFLCAASGAFGQIIFYAYVVTASPNGSLISNPGVFATNNNSINNVFQGYPTVPTGSLLDIIDSQGNFLNELYYISGGGWYDESTFTPSTYQFNPGTVAVFYPNSTTNVTFSFTVTTNTPVLPEPMACGKFYVYGRQTAGIGTFENITGLTPVDGSQLFILNEAFGYAFDAPPPLNSAEFTAYTFCGGGWLPNDPMVPLGHGAWVFQPCISNGCVTVQAPATVYATNSGPVAVDYTSALFITDSCGGGFNPPAPGSRVLGRPPPGSLFNPGTTPVHCVAIDNLGNAGRCDFTVTVVPPPVLPPKSSYALGLVTGQNLIAYQFINGGNTLGEIMTNVPDGTVVSKYNNASSNWSLSTYNAALNAWVPPNITLKPGDGAFLNSPSNFVLQFSGQPVHPSLPVPLTNALIMISRQTNGAGNFTNITGSLPTVGTTVYKWSPAASSYSAFTYTATGWSPFEPTTGIGESWWIAPFGGGPPPPVPIPPAIVTQPSNILTSLGANTNFFVSATGSAPLFYQWRLNGNPVPGATNSFFPFANIQASNCGNYDVLVQNAVGIVDSITVGLTITNTTPLLFSDAFATAGNLPTTTNGLGSASNVGATVETGEPNPGFIPGGASMWTRWVAPITGVATFSTAGSGFDTLLAIYTGSVLTNLTPVASDDDSAGFLWSSASFNAVAGSNYAIQVDGFYGASGKFLLNWKMLPGTNQLPIIVTQPQSQTVATGANATFTVATSAGGSVAYQWIRNGVDIARANASSYTISNVTSSQVAFYQARVTNLFGGLTVTSLPGDLQINSAGPGLPINSLARAETKFKAATDPTIRPGDPYDPPIVTGYSGVQIFSAYGSVSEPNEPLHCGVTCYFTKWHSYAAPVDGLVSVANQGTTFPGVLGVYTMANLSLQPIACSAGNPAGAEACSFETKAGVTYEIAMSGTNANDSGTVQLQYATLAPPLYTALPISQTYSSNNTVVLSVSTTGNPQVEYQWQLNGVDIAGATNATLDVTNFGVANQGNYTVLAINSVATNLFRFAPIYLNNPPQLVNTSVVSNQLQVQLMGFANSNYVFQTSTDRVNWVTLSSANSPSGIINFSDTINLSNKIRFYRGYLPPPVQ